MPKEDKNFETTQRVLLLYALHQIGIPISRERLSPVLLTSGGDWIGFTLRIHQLIQDGLIEEEERDEIQITTDGEAVLKAFRSSLSKDCKDKIDEYLKAHKAEIIDQFQATANYEERDGRYLVKLSIRERGELLLGTEMEVLTPTQANVVIRNFLKDPSDFYISVIEKLTFG